MTSGVCAQSSSHDVASSVIFLLVIGTPPACPSDKSRGDATTSPLGAYWCLLHCVPIAATPSAIFWTRRISCCTTATAAWPLTISIGATHYLPLDQHRLTNPPIRFSISFMKEAGMGDAATGGAGYIAGREAEEAGRWR